MNETTDSLEISQLAARARLLSPADRRALIDELVISLDCDADADPLDIERAWDEEIARRVEAADKGDVQWIDGETVLAEMRAILAPRR
jgi:hypothetical protein